MSLSKGIPPVALFGNETNTPTNPKTAPDPHPFDRIFFGLATLFIMVEAFEKFFDKFVKTILEAHFKSNPLESNETWLTKCEQTFGGAMKKNFQLIPTAKKDAVEDSSAPKAAAKKARKDTPAKVTPSKKKPVKADANDDGKTTQSEKDDKEDVATLPQWDTYIICTLLKEYLQTVS